MMIDHDVQCEAELRVELYGTFAAFRDVARNKWDLLGQILEKVLQPADHRGADGAHWNTVRKRWPSAGIAQLWALRSTYACTS
jgi:hypothetical protein